MWWKCPNRKWDGPSGPPWQHFHVKNTGKGPMVWQARRTRFYPREQELPGEECWLIVARNPLTGETKHFVSNACEHTSFEVLLHVAFNRWRIERIFEDGKGQIGFDHFEVRNYLPLMRHLILSMVSLLFLTQQTHRLREKNIPWSVRQVRLATEAQLDTRATRHQRSARLERAAAQIEYWQRSSARSARAHHRRRCKELRKQGIYISKLRKRYDVF